MDSKQVMQEFEDAKAILRGHFILSSGLHSEMYLQCARVLMDSSRADRLCAALAAKVREALGQDAIDMVVAPAMGGVVVGYEMGRQLKIPSIFCERVDGSFQLRRGFDIPEGSRILVVEVVVTTGKSSRETFDCIAAYGGKVVAEASLIDRSGGNSNLGVPLFSLMTLEIPTYHPDSLPDHLKNVPAVKPGSRWLKS
jgi:orotate phosphoribosyltransferase